MASGASPLSVHSQSPRVNVRRKKWITVSIARVFLWHQSKMTIVCCPSCPLPLFSSHPNFLPHLRTENNKQKVEGSIMMVCILVGVALTFKLSILARKKKTKNPNSIACWSCKFPCTLLVSVSENQAVG